MATQGREVAACSETYLNVFLGHGAQCANPYGGGIGYANGESEKLSPPNHVSREFNFLMMSGEGS